MDGTTYSMDLRERVVRAVESGRSRRATAAKFEVSPSFVIKLMHAGAGSGTVQPERNGGSNRSMLAAHAERVHELVAAEPDLTIAELRTRQAAAGIAASRSGGSTIYKPSAGLTRKKSPGARPSRTGRTSPPHGELARAAAGLTRALVFLDETWATDQHGSALWPSPAGHAVGGAVPHGHWKTTTSSLRSATTA